MHTCLIRAVLQVMHTSQSQSNQMLGPSCMMLQSRVFSVVRSRSYCDSILLVLHMVLVANGCCSYA